MFMKQRFILFVFGLFFANYSFAYYNSYGYGKTEPTSPFDVLLYIIFFVFGILQIILFFKVWGMTNNIKKIKKHVIGNYEEILDSNFRRLAYMGETEELKEKMINTFIHEVQEAYLKLPKDESVVIDGRYGRLGTDKSISPYKEILRKQLESIGEQLPSMIEKTETFDDYIKSYRDIDFYKEYESIQC